MLDSKRSLHVGSDGSVNVNYWISRKSKPWFIALAHFYVVNETMFPDSKIPSDTTECYFLCVGGMLTGSMSGWDTAPTDSYRVSP